MLVAIIIGVILAGIGGFLIYNRQFALNKAMNVRYHQTTQIREELEIYQAVAAGVGKGSYSGKIVEFKGICMTKNPLEAEHSGTPCVYYEATVTREYEYTSTSTDSEGRTHTETRRGSETVSSNKRAVKFYLNDGSGEEILVDSEGASIDSIKTYDQFEREPRQGFSWTSLISGSRTLGYQYTERCIPVKAQLYVLGELSDRGGEVAVVKPTKEGENYIISTKSEEQIVADAQSSAGWQLWGGIALIIAGIITAVVGIFVK